MASLCWQQFLLMAVIGLSSICCVVHGHGYMTVQFLQYNNQDSRCADGTYCDTILFFNSKESDCDPVFRLRADRSTPGGSNMFDYQQSDFYNNQDVINFDNNFAGISNPVIIAMNFVDNTGKLYITVNVDDKDSFQNDKIDVFSAALEASGSGVKSETMISAYMGHTLSLKYWYTCHTFYHGPLCNVYCRDQDSDSDGHYTCGGNGNKICRDGWIGASTDCKTRHPCRVGVCQNGATCVPVGESYSCQCPMDFVGTNCEQFRDPCVYRNPCINGAECTLSSDRQPQCRCTPQFTGERCDVDVDECAVSKPCSNGMPCVNTYGGFRCNCTDAQFIGGRCEIDRCNGTECLNNGTCLATSTDSTPRCRCLAGFTGVACEVPNPCYSSPCQNGAVCRNEPSEEAEFTCVCPAGYRGSLCEAVQPDFCASSPCLNGGNCTSGISRFTCDCLPGFVGLTCEVLVTSPTTTTPSPTRVTGPVIGGLIGENPGNIAADQASAGGISVAGATAGSVIGFLILGGVAAFLTVFLLRRRANMAESTGFGEVEDSNSDGFSNAVYNNASIGAETVRSFEAPTVRVEDEGGDIYEAVGGADPDVAEPVGDQVNRAYEADA